MGAPRPSLWLAMMNREEKLLTGQEKNLKNLPFGSREAVRAVAYAMLSQAGNE